MKKNKVFKVGFEGGHCLALTKKEVNSIIENEIINNELESSEIGDVFDFDITVSIIEMTQKEIDNAGEFDGF